MAGGPSTEYLRRWLIGVVTEYRLRNIIHTLGIPRAEDDPPIGWILLDFPDTVPQLIDTLPLVILLTINILCPKMSPLKPIYRPQITLSPVLKASALQESFGPIAIPDLHALL